MLFTKRKNNSVVQLSSCPVVQCDTQTQRGFTLIEMLIVSIILVVVSIAIYSVLNNGLKIWQRVNQAVPQEDLAIFFDKFASDLRNAFEFSTLSFAGDDNRVEFATLVNSPALKKITPGKIVYFFDMARGTLSREQKDFSQIYSRESGKVVNLLNNVKSASFKYYYYDKEKKEYIWEDSWSKEGLPLAVRIEMKWDNGKKIDEFRRTVSIPVSD